MQYLRENILMKAGRLRTITIAGHNFKVLPVYDRGGKSLEGMFKTYNDALPEGQYPMGEPSFNDIVKLLTMRDESKYVLSTYYIKFRHGNTVFGAMLDIIG